MKHPNTNPDILSQVPDDKKADLQRQIAEAGSNLRQYNMKDVEEVSWPGLTPPARPVPYPALEKIDLTAETRENIEAISKARGNRELQQTPFERALSQPTNDNQPENHRPAPKRQMELER